MQLMTWTLARLGSQFSLQFEPHSCQVRHSAVGRLYNQPLDLMVGMTEPDGTERVLPFSSRGTLLSHTEQFDRLNSITFRGYSWSCGIRFELNIHSVFYPQDESLCIMPAFYLEMRVGPAKHQQDGEASVQVPKKVKLFIRLDSPSAQIKASLPEDNQTVGGQIDLHYQGEVGEDVAASSTGQGNGIDAYERIVSLNRDCDVESDGKGLTVELPVTAVGSGIKWRLVWGAHCAKTIPLIGPDSSMSPVRLRYLNHWSDLNTVMDDAIRLRDDRLAHSRRLERLVDQTPLTMAQRHLLNQSFQSFLDNTFWCSLEDGSDQYCECEDGSVCRRSIDVGYHTSMIYLTMWPDLLAKQLDQWSRQEAPHQLSGGSYLDDTSAFEPNSGDATAVDGSPLESSCQYLILLHAHAHWTGKLAAVRRHIDLVGRLAKYLLWADRDNSGFPSSSIVSSIAGADQPMQEDHRMTSLAVLRLAALQAAGDLLGREGDTEADTYTRRVKQDVEKIESRAWMGEHYTQCIDQIEASLLDPWTDFVATPRVDQDSYAIDIGSGLLLSMMTAQQPIFNVQRMQADVANAGRETLAPYGCGDNSSDTENIKISKNLWRDHLALYLHSGHPAWHQRYWDLQITSNTYEQSVGYCDTYLGNNQRSSPRGVVSFGFLLACPRVVIDRLAPGGGAISVEPNRHFAKRWPLLPLADWKAGRIPVCVVDAAGKVTIEGESGPIRILGDEAANPHVMG